MKNKASSYLGVIIPLTLGALLTVYLYFSFTPEQTETIKKHFLTANYSYVGMALFIAFLGYAFRAYRWKYTLAEIGSHPGFLINFLAVSIGYFVNLGIPRSGEVSRAMILKKYRDVPFDKAFGTIIAERIVDFAVLLLLITASVVLEFSTLKTFLLTNIPINLLIVLGCLGFAGLLTLFYLYNFSQWKYILLVKSKINGLKEGILSVRNMPDKLPFLAYTVLIWASYIAMFYLTVCSLDATKNISLGTTIVAFVIGGLVMTFTNGGFGFFPPLIGNILFLYHIPKEAGQALGWIIWTSQFLITVFLGLLSFLVLPIVGQKK
ncbi:lysylphosphatidylglycerol synthase transmembrane domain-containing protein [Flavobacterium humi]|uniref:lysylphosphatidylglycerol synthase transmembrane domain-containing protein n=1 Tax=Flavobacterium humi TaxID=2562683 RepID=UPI001FEC0876|nr:lysylphosphatidylglycerol synthase transmembrane domain-containing protein [Flavobacterium humi]